MITPFSVLDTRTKEWKDRKDYWIRGYGIQSELGRENTQSKTIFAKQMICVKYLCSLLLLKKAFRGYVWKRTVTCRQQF